MVSVDDVRQVVRDLPRSSEHLIADRLKFRVGKIVYLAFSRDETVMGFAFPKDERDALVASDPAIFHLPRQSDLRFNWVQAWLSELDEDLMTELVLDAWRIVVPKKVWSAHLPSLGLGRPAVIRAGERRSPPG
ncbi:MmcQ/YjbR family DNA-binding protein [Actinoplanes solisilvae]|uniref:MmcQ/YjbR family DNA-binding protein n=1 Tax=Actinoplanes solisilvae TaxID=2486853 RepID=UPI000FD8E950|nr:MmcQ/YjbR family DNA-binding protein [Actinoplanes solisilvae]